jgi:hypothetical protein
MVERSINHVLAGLFVAGPLTLVAMWFAIDGFDGGDWLVVLAGFTSAMAALSLIEVARESWERAALLVALAAGVGVAIVGAALTTDDLAQGIGFLLAANLAAGLLIGRWWFLVFALLSFPLYFISVVTMPAAALGVAIAKYIAYRDRHRDRSTGHQAAYRTW